MLRVILFDEASVQPTAAPPLTTTNDTFSFPRVLYFHTAVDVYVFVCNRASLRPEPHRLLIDSREQCDEQRPRWRPIVPGANLIRRTPAATTARTVVHVFSLDCYSNGW